MPPVQSLLDLVFEHPDFQRKARLPSLFSDFAPLRISNVDGYEANITAWIKALNKAVIQRSLSAQESALCLSLDATLISQLLSPQWGRPLALASVEMEAVKRQTWISYDDFMTSQKSVYHVQSIMEQMSLHNILAWGVQRMWPRSNANFLAGHRYIILPNLEVIADQVLSLLRSDTERSYSGHVLTREMLQKRLEEMKKCHVDTLDLDVLLRFLERDRGSLSTKDDTIKIMATDGLKDPVTQVDIAVAQLRHTIERLQEQITELSEKSSVSAKSAQAAVAKGQKILALSALRTRKLVDATLTQRTLELSQMETLLSKIDDSASNIGILKAMEGGSVALQQLIKEIGGIDRVDEIVDQVQEQMQISDEIGRAVVLPTNASIDEDVEDEWLEMCRREEEDALQSQQDGVKKIAEEPSESAQVTQAQITEKTPQLAS